MKPTDPDLGLTPTLVATLADEVPRRSSRDSLVGYQLGALLGRGGMGEIVMARDENIGRDIAIKRMKTDKPSPEATARFLREARVQARLEHPAIVPVHHVGNDEDGQPFFTMKRLAGVTLAELLAATPPPPLQRLLRAFTDVCNAVEFAHSRGVVHRDLKPANIMLGDFGEVYVLDWGLARATSDGDDVSIGADIDSLDGMTQAGAILGTPGYMAPEQIAAAPDVAGPADVYALGSILFEILAGEALHPRGNAAMMTTLAAIDGSPAKRQPARGIPPELDQLCIAALAQAPGARPTAHQLATRVEGYLDGDRDLERRKQLSSDWLTKAREALADDEIGRRAEALQYAGRALALDPDSRAATELFTRLILVPPMKLPVDLERELAAIDTATQRKQARVAMVSFFAFVVFLAMASWNGLRSAATVFAIGGMAAVMAACAFMLSRRRASTAEMFLVVLGNATLAAALSRSFGSLIIAPAVTGIMAVSLTSYPQLIDRARIVIAILVASWLVPVALEAAGVLAETWRVVDGQVISSSPMVSIAAPSTTTLLIVANVITTIVIGLFANALARSRRDAQRRVEIQAWHLRQLLP